MRPPTITLLLAGLAILPAAAAEPEPAVTLTPLPAVTRGVAAFPQVSGPQAERINQSLRRADARVRAAAAECKPPGETRSTWRRTIAVTMRGPRLLSLLAEDSWYCGAYPDEAPIALVFDLETGAPVNWARFLPPSFVGKTTIDSAGDGTRIGMVQSPTLAELYRKGLTEEQCGDVVEDDQAAFQLWPDAKAGGLVVRIMTLPHAIAVCAERVTIPLDTLRRLNAPRALLDALATAHRAGG